VEDTGFTQTAARMRTDWDARALRDAERFVYTRDSAADEADFDSSGRANFLQLVRPYLPLLVEGRDPRSARALEIGCGVGRMTRWFAEYFGEVDGVDVSPEMARLARERLRGIGNARIHEGSGTDLSGFASESFDLVFSYIVFQHIPSKAVIENYVREAARVLRPGGFLKFQLNGAPVEHAPDTWVGVSYSLGEARALVESAGFSLAAAEGPGTQYMVLTARKGRMPEFAGLRPYVLPGEDWAERQLLSGFGAPVDRSWRPMAARAQIRLAHPGGERRFYLGLYLWSGERVTVNGEHLLEGAGDHYVEFPAHSGEIALALDPAPARAPAFRIAGVY
jgi:SAM-dependent methyltransferase